MGSHAECVGVGCDCGCLSPILSPGGFGAFVRFLGASGAAGLTLIGGEGAGALIHAGATRIPFAGLDERMDSIQGMGVSKVTGKALTSLFFYLCGLRTRPGTMGNRFCSTSAVVNAAAIPVDILDTILAHYDYQAMEEVAPESISLRNSNVRARNFTNVMKRSRTRT